MFEEWRKIPEFPNYSISNTGYVRNDRTGLWLKGLVNGHGILHVGLSKDGVVCKRAVAPMVANMYLPRPREESFNTPINLDGNKTNCWVGNLMWRPLWFARKYALQFTLQGFEYPVAEIGTGKKFDSAWYAAMHYGVLVKEIAYSTVTGVYVWPAYKVFRRLV